MPLVFASIMPHGDALIPGLGDPVHSSKPLTAAMRRLSRSAAAMELDAIVVATPHGVGIDGAHAIGMSRQVSGSLGHLDLDVKTDRTLANSILAGSIGANLPCCGVVYGNDEVPLPMDWGVFVPAWFLEEAGAIAPSVVVCPSRQFPLETLAGLGEVIAIVAERSRKRIALVASADNAHAHLEDGPYGFHPSARKFDEMIVDVTKRGEFEEYARFDPLLVEEALPDSPWQLAILAGAFRKVPFKTVDVTYDCPSYFGMMCAWFDRS